MEIRRDSIEIDGDWRLPYSGLGRASQHAAYHGFSVRHELISQILFPCDTDI